MKGKRGSQLNKSNDDLSISGVYSISKKFVKNQPPPDSLILNARENRAVPTYSNRGAESVRSENSNAKVGEIQDEVKDGKREKVGSRGFNPKEVRVSTVLRPHNSLFKGSVGKGTENEDVFERIKDHLMEFESYDGFAKNRWATLVQKDQGRGYTFRINEYGKINVHIPEQYGLNIILSNVRNDFDFLTEDEFGRMISAIVPEYAHVASAVICTDKTKELLKNAEAEITILGQKIADANYDFSVKVGELEFKGNPFLCLFLMEKMHMKEVIIELNENISRVSVEFQQAIIKLKREILSLKRAMNKK